MTTYRRAGGREPEQLRQLEITTDAVPYAEGSALIKLGQTHVLCAATVEERVPRWMVGKGKGWVTAEYSMLPRATRERTQREATAGKQTGRTVEIQRLQSRSIAFSAKDLCWQQSFRTKMLNQDLCGFRGVGGGVVVLRQIICLSRNIKTGERTSRQILQEYYFYRGGWGWGEGQ